jgi:hypothetical protein
MNYMPSRFTPSVEFVCGDGRPKKKSPPECTGGRLSYRGFNCLDRSRRRRTFVSRPMPPPAKSITADGSGIAAVGLKLLKASPMPVLVPVKVNRTSSTPTDSGVGFWVSTIRRVLPGGGSGSAALLARFFQRLRRRRVAGMHAHVGCPPRRCGTSAAISARPID